MEFYSQGVYYSMINGIRAERTVNQRAWQMTAPHFHNVYELIYLTEGERVLEVGSQSCHVKQGEIMLLAPWEAHRTGIAEGYPLMSRYLVYFSFEQLGGLLSEREENWLEEGMRRTCVIRMDTGKQKVLETLLGGVAGYFNTPGLLHEKLGKFGIVRLLNFIRELPQEGFRYFEAEKYMVREEIMIALAYISENRGNPDISLKDVTERVHMSQSRFCALFKETTGRGFLNYLNRMRVTWAESELRLALRRTALL